MDDPDFSTMTADEIGKILRDHVDRLNLLQSQAARCGASLTLEVLDVTGFADQSRCYRVEAWGPGARSDLETHS